MHLSCCRHIGKREDPGDEVGFNATAMAEVPKSRSVPSGHDEQFINPPDEDLHCIICFLPSKEPVLQDVVTGLFGFDFYFGWRDS